MNELRPWCCKECGLALGNTDGKALFAGAMRFDKFVTIRCAKCGREQQWRRDDDPKNQANVKRQD